MSGLTPKIQREGPEVLYLSFQVVTYGQSMPCKRANWHFFFSYISML